MKTRLEGVQYGFESDVLNSGKVNVAKVIRSDLTVYCIRTSRGANS
jgi:hypothetical protein